MKYLALMFGVVATLAGSPHAAAADDYPSKTIRMVLPYAAGGPTDTVARVVAQQMAKTLGKPIIVENRPGADSTIGAENVARSPADGYSVLFATSSMAINTSVYPNLGYDAVRDFTAIGLVGTQYLVLVYNPELKFADLKSFISQVKTDPAKYSYGTSGTTVTLVTELFHSHAGISGGTRIPYNGNAPLLNAFYTGVLHYTFMSLDSGIGAIKNGKMVPLAVTSPKRVSALPDIPTTTEAGVPDTTAGVWYMLMAPRQTPAPIVAKLNDALNQALASPEVKELAGKFTGLIMPEKTGVEAANQYMKSETSRWAPLVKTTGVRPS